MIRGQDIQRAQFARQRPQAGQIHIQDNQYFQDEIVRWYERCWTCAQDGMDDQHELFRCWADLNQAAKAWWVQVRKEIRYEAYSAHYWCGMPQAMCPRGDPSKVQADTAEARTQCDRYRTTLGPMVAMMLYSRKTHPAIRTA